MTRLRKTLLSLGVVAALLGGAAVIVPPLLWGPQANYSYVVSIKTTHEYQDPILLQKAWALPVAMLYHRDIEYQHNASFCGPTSLANVLRSLNHPADQATILQGTGFSPVLGYLPAGLTLDQVAEIAKRKLGGKITVLRNLNRAGFRAELRHVNDPSRRYLVNFSRGPLFGKGGGHHSPIAGYLVDEDLVLVLDVNQKYGPWLVKSERLFEAMDTSDGTSQQKRGLVLIE